LDWKKGESHVKPWRGGIVTGKDMKEAAREDFSIKKPGERPAPGLCLSRPVGAQGL
jgi:hypothetical protein